MPRDRVQSRCWCFTWNNPPENWKRSFEVLRKAPAGIVVLCIAAGVEHLDRGTPHVQGYAVFSRPLKLGPNSWLKVTWPTIHWEIRRGSEQDAIDYTKKEQRNPAFRLDWDDRRAGSRSDIHAASAVITADPRRGVEALAASHPELVVKYHQGFKVLASLLMKKEMPYHYPRVCFWYWGIPGAGKTHAAYAKALELGYADAEIYSWTTPNMQYAGRYSGELCVIIDDLKRSWKNFSFSSLLALLGDYRHIVEVKYGESPWMAKHVIVTTTGPPAEFLTPDEARLSGAAVSQLTRRLTEVREFSEVHGLANASTRAAVAAAAALDVGQPCDRATPPVSPVDFVPCYPGSRECTPPSDAESLRRLSRLFRGVPSRRRRAEVLSSSESEVGLP